MYAACKYLHINIKCDSTKSYLILMKLHKIDPCWKIKHPFQFYYHDLISDIISGDIVTWDCKKRIHSSNLNQTWYGRWLISRAEPIIAIPYGTRFDLSMLQCSFSVIYIDKSLGNWFKSNIMIKYCSASGATAPGPYSIPYSLDILTIL